MGDEADLHGSQQEVALRQRLESPLGSGWHRRVAAKHGKRGLRRGDQGCLQGQMLHIRIVCSHLCPFLFLHHESWRVSPLEACLKAGERSAS